MNLISGIGAFAQSIFFKIAFAINTTPGGNTSPSFTLSLKNLNPFGKCDNVLCIAGNVFSAARIISIPLVIFFIFWGAFYILTSAGNENRIKEGRKIITWAIVGFILVLAAGGMAQLIINIVSPSSMCSPTPGTPNYSPDCVGPPTS